MLGCLSHEALAYAFLEQMVHAFKWETLTPPLYQAFEALFRHYHVTKGPAAPALTPTPTLPLTPTLTPTLTLTCCRAHAV